VACGPVTRRYCEIGICTAVLARQWPSNNNRRMVFCAWSTKQQLNSNRGTVFSVWSVPRCYKQDKSRVWSVVGQLPASKKMSMKAEDIVGIHHQAMTGEDTRD
jgi:hypothetical protein